MPTDAYDVILAIARELAILVLLPLAVYGVMSLLMPDTLRRVRRKGVLRAYLFSQPGIALYAAHHFAQLWQVLLYSAQSSGLMAGWPPLLILLIFFALHHYAFASTLVPILAVIYFPLSLVFLKLRWDTVFVALPVSAILGALIAFLLMTNPARFFVIWLEHFLPLAVLMAGFNLGMGFSLFRRRRSEPAA
jgi:hypothetical protein